MRALLLALLLAPAAATGQVMGAHIHSHHTSTTSANNQNLGLYLRSASGWQVGAYRNSFRENTLYLGSMVATPLPLDVFLGGATGYPYSPLVPMVVASKAIPVGNGFVRLSMSIARTGPLYHLSVEHPY